MTRARTKIATFATRSANCHVGVATRLRRSEACFSLWALLGSNQWPSSPWKALDRRTHSMTTAQSCGPRWSACPSTVNRMKGCRWLAVVKGPARAWFTRPRQRAQRSRVVINSPMTGVADHLGPRFRPVPQGRRCGAYVKDGLRAVWKQRLDPGPRGRWKVASTPRTAFSGTRSHASGTPAPLVVGTYRGEAGVRLGRGRHREQGPTRCYSLSP
jgi:hypothetical protein